MQVEVSLNEASLSHRQMSMPKPVCPNMATVTSIASAGPGQRRSSTPGGLRWARSHPPPQSIFPRARDGRSLPRCGELTFRTLPRRRPRARTPKDSVPWRRSSREQRAQNRPVPVSTASWRQDLRRTHQPVTGRSDRPRSTWPNQARLALPRGHAVLQTGALSWLEQFQIDALMFVKGIV
jgi:hypothetical protein